MMHWGEPHYLHLLWLIPPLALFLYALMRRREILLRQLVHHRDEYDYEVRVDRQEILRRKTEASPSGSSSLSDRLPGRARRRLLIWLAAFTLAVTALARPQWGETLEEIPHQGLDIMVVLDVSNSMRAEDFRPSRLERARMGIRDLLPRLKGDRIGLVVFEGVSVMECPLTVDYAGFRMVLDDVFPGMTPQGGTAIEQALRFAAEQFDESITADRVILLISDGEDHEGNPVAAVPLLRERDIRVFSVGVGTPEGDLIPVTDERGQVQYMRDRDGHVVRTRLHENALEQLALRTGGMYVRAVPGDFGLDRIYEDGIRPLQRAELDIVTIKKFQDRYPWFLAAALLLLCVETMLTEKKFINKSAVT